MIISFIALVTLLTVINPSSGDNPGARIILTQKGLDFATQTALPILKSTLKEIKIPGISGDKMGCHYKLSNFHIGNIQLPETEFSVSTGTSGLTMKADDVSLSGGVDYSYRCFLGIGGSGTADLGVSDASISFTILVNKDATGHPILEPNGCSLDISKINIEFHGSLASLANLFKGTIKEKLQSYAKSNACSKLSDLIKNKGNSFLQDFATEMSIDDIIVIDYSLVNNPMFTNVDLQVGIKGEFTSTNPEAEKPPFKPSPIPEVADASKMIYLVASPYLVNTAAFVFQEEGYLKYNVTPETLPSGEIVIFNTILFQDLVPEFYNKYPDMNITLNIYLIKPPLLKITTEEARLQGTAVIEVAVYDANCDNAIVHAFSLEVKGSTEIKIGLNQVDSKTNLTGKIDSLDFQISVKDTEVGVVNATKLTELVHLLGKQLIIPIVNKYASVGWPIPTFYGVELENSEVTLGNEYILVGTDIKFETKQPLLQALGQDKVSQTQSSDKVSQMQSSDMVSQTQSSDMVSQTKSSDKVDQTQSSDKVSQTQSSDKKLKSRVQF